MQLFVLILFNAGVHGGAGPHLRHTAQVIRVSAEMDYDEHREHLAFMDLIADQFDFNDHAGRP